MMTAPPPLPILLYHSVNDDPPSWIAPFTVSARTFAKQLDLVKASGRVPVTARQVVEALRGGPRLPPEAVLITFDDAFRDFVEVALPALSERHLRATLFVTTGSLGPLNRSLLPPAPMMCLKQVIAVAEEGVEIGAHSHTHAQLDTLSQARVSAELSRSRETLEDALGAAVTLFAYPHGYADKQVRELARQAGYDGAFAVRNALSPSVDDAYRIARLTVRADTGAERFAQWLRGEDTRVASHHESAATKLWRAYRKGRAALRAPSTMT